MNPSSLPELALASEPAARRTLDPSQCTLAVVDLQEKLVPAIHHQEEMVRNCQILIRLASILGIPTILSTQYVRGLGPTVPDIASLLESVPPIDKTSFGCFGCDEFRDALTKLPGHRTTVLLCG